MIDYTFEFLTILHNIAKTWWNDNLTELKLNSCNAYYEWLNANKPRFGNIFNKMKSTKLIFKKAIKDSKRFDDERFLKTVLMLLM